MVKQRGRLRSRVEPTLHKIADKLGDLAIASMAAHPIVVCIFVQTGAAIAQCILEKESEAWWHMNRLGTSAFDIAIASAVVPIVPGALNLLGSVIAAKKAEAPATIALPASAYWPTYTEEFRESKARHAFP